MFIRLFLSLITASFCLTTIPNVANAKTDCTIAEADQVDIWHIQREAKIDAQFDYSMPSRYEVGPNGRVLLPNTQDYVLNKKTQDYRTEAACSCPSGDRACLRDPARFQVSFDASQTTWEDGFYTLKSQEKLEDEFAAIGCANPKDRATKYRQDAISSRPKSFGRFGNAEFSWTIELDGHSTVIRKEGKSPQICLPEGRHRVSLKIEGEREDAVKVLTRTVPIKDHLIVVLGDSYGAGEGAPEVSHLPTKNWERSDNGNAVIVNDFFATLPDLSPTELMPAASWAKSGDETTMSRKFFSKYNGVAIEQGLAVPSFDSMAKRYRSAATKDPLETAYWDNVRSHRSSFTHASQLALELENSDDRSSVTFVNLAQSGATVRKGILGPYRGIEYYYRDQTDGISWSDFDYKKNMPDARCLLDNGVPARHMCPQIMQLAHVIGNRNIDKLFISVGGNDVGFSQAITLMTIAPRSNLQWYNPSAGPAKCVDSSFTTGTSVSGAMCSVLKAVGDGQFPAHLGSLIEELALSGAENVAGLDGLAEDYDNLNTALRDIKNQSGDALVSDITLIAPPFFGKLPKSVAISRNFPAIIPAGRYDGIEAAYCGISFFRDYIRRGDLLEVHPKEFQFAEYEIYNPLVEVMDAASTQLGWKLLVQNQNDISLHGICGNDPYTGRRGTNPRLHNPTHPINLSSASANGIRWYRQPAEAGYLQAGHEINNTGLFHPNEYGYAYVSGLMKRAITSDDRFRGLRNKYSQDTLVEAKTIPSGANNAGINFKDDDVQIFQVRVPSLHQLNVSYLSTRSRNRLTCPAITVFDKFGDVLVTSSPTLNVLDQRSFRKTKGETLPRLGTLNSDPCRTLSLATQIDRSAPGFQSTARRSHGLVVQRTMPSILPEGRSVKDLGLAMDSRATKPLSYANGLGAQTVYIAVSHPENVLFDPVLGFGKTTPSEVIHAEGELRIGFIDRSKTNEGFMRPVLNPALKEERGRLVQPDIPGAKRRTIPIPED